MLLTSAWESIKDFFGWETEEEMKYSWGEEHYEEIYNNTILTAGANELENKLENEILQELNGKDGDIEIRIIADQKSGEIYIERTEIIIYPSGLTLDPRFMKNYISKRLECECVVIYKSDK